MFLIHLQAEHTRLELPSPCVTNVILYIRIQSSCSVREAASDSKLLTLLPRFSVLDSKQSIEACQGPDELPYIRLAGV